MIFIKRGKNKNPERILTRAKTKTVNASFFVHELLNKPNWRLEFQVSNSKWG